MYQRILTILILILILCIAILSGCIVMKEERLLATLFNTQIASTKLFYKFMENGEYKIEDITKFNQINSQLSFILKDKIYYMYRLNGENIEVLITSPSKQKLLEDIINLVNYGLANDQYNNEIKEMLNTILKDNSKQELHITLDYHTADITFDATQEGELVILMQGNIK